MAIKKRTKQIIVHMGSIVEMLKALEESKA